MIDFLIIYEHEQRELENVTLLGAELERRGYSVCFEKVPFINSYLKLKRKHKNNVKLIMTPTMYSEEVIRSKVYNLGGFVKKIVNFQWEQVGTIADETNFDAFRYPKKSAKRVPYLCWGKKMQELLVKSGMDREKAIVTGPIHMDFLRKEFNGYYMSKEELFKQYNLPLNKKVNLFLSSFGYTCLTSQLRELLYKSVGKDRVDTFEKISIESQKSILEWIERYLKENPNEIFIYRPHPVESGSKLLAEVNERNPNMYVIGEHSVKQWIKTCDTIFNWFSTSMAEAYYADKQTYVLRPVEIPFKNDVAIMRDCKFITTYEDFSAAAQGATENVASTDAIKAYYDVTDIPAYVRTADFLEELLKTNKYDFEWTSDMKRQYILYGIKIRIRVFFGSIYHRVRWGAHSFMKLLHMKYNIDYVDFYKNREHNAKYYKERQEEKLAIMKKMIESK